jgi:hypothetical protein
MLRRIHLAIRWAGVLAILAVVASLVFIWLAPSRDVTCNTSKRIDKARKGERYWCLID